ncbi:MAG: asparagine synthase (glutamine-hydrolyzing) [Planctomycetota bacterium]
MCGIGGILRRDGGEIPDAWLPTIDERIAHRGPDGRGEFRDRVEIDGPDGPQTIDVAMIHRRLSIIDLDTGDQPMVSERGRSDEEGLLAVVFNGCIYNHRDLRDELTAAGHVFITDHSDTEVLLHGYREWGADLAEHLEGMYAFALWDRDNARLTLSRDWFGEKPLWLRWNVDGASDVLAFASDAKALHDLDDATTHTAPPIGDRLWLPRYLQVGYHWSTTSPYADLSATPVTSAAPTIVSTIDDLMPTRPKESATQADFEDALRDAVHRRLEADVPLGCFLSGGVDSSVVAAFAREVRPDLQTFCVRMPDERYDESAVAADAAEQLGTNHTTLDVAPEPARDLVHLIHTLGLPFGDSSLLPTYWVSKAAREHVKVALSGDGGDEMFVGYKRLVGARTVNRHQRVLKWIPERIMRNAHPTSRKYLLGRLGHISRDMRALGILGIESLFYQSQITELLGMKSSSPALAVNGPDPLQSLRRIDCISYLPNDLLLKVDTASMAVALEVRCPFLDREVVRCALAAPTHQLLPGGRRKGLLRAIAKKYLPADLVDRPKQGFAIPIGEWFRDDTGGMRTLLTDRLTCDRPFGPFSLRAPIVQRFIDEHMDETIDHSQRLFALLTLAIWAQDCL